MNPGKIQAFGALENYHCTRHWKNMESFGNFTEIILIYILTINSIRL